MPADELTPGQAGAADEPIAQVLRDGELEVVGRMPWSSNGTFLCEVHCGPQTMRAIYKPRQGERPLWDFPSGLDQREVAAYELSRLLGWDIVPVTVRRDGPLGLGSVQAFVEADFEQHYFTLYEDEANHPTLRRLCAFDFVGNNTDRKSGHCLLGLDGRIKGIDHGLMFHQEFKLRTVIWEFGSEPIPDADLADLTRLLDDGLPPELAMLLDVFERDALLARTRALVNAGHFPIDETGRRYPWPLV
ncbi:MAG: SCO1664 family protein [Actinomycetota bacterium]|nr:SCO1664 family protein [Actinomycetota bacterium]